MILFVLFRPQKRKTARYATLGRIVPFNATVGRGVPFTATVGRVVPFNLASWSLEYAVLSVPLRSVQFSLTRVLCSVGVVSDPPKCMCIALYCKNGALPAGRAASQCFKFCPYRSWGTVQFLLARVGPRS